jgi:hypothetical protein
MARGLPITSPGASGQRVAVLEGEAEERLGSVHAQLGAHACAVVLDGLGADERSGLQSVEIKTAGEIRAAEGYLVVTGVCGNCEAQEQAG